MSPSLHKDSLCVKGADKGRQTAFAVLLPCLAKRHGIFAAQEIAQSIVLRVQPA